MKRILVLAGTAAILFAFAGSAQTGNSNLAVDVSYTGAGTVDGSHKIYVALWDTPDFLKDSSSVMPIEVKAVTSKSATAQFDNVSKNPVYVSMAYDPTGKWEAMSPPPSGSSLGVYSKEPGTPAPVQLQPGKTTNIAATFDDSIKMK